MNGRERSCSGGSGGIQVLKIRPLRLTRYSGCRGSAFDQSRGEEVLEEEEVEVEVDGGGLNDGF